MGRSDWWIGFALCMFMNCLGVLSQAERMSSQLRMISTQNETAENHDESKRAPQRRVSSSSAPSSYLFRPFSLRTNTNTAITYF